MFKSKHVKAILLILVVLFTLSRLVNLDSDRPIHFFGYVDDEGLYTQQSRSKVLFGEILNNL